MPVIKSANSPASVHAFSMTDIENSAKSMLLRAQRKAEDLLAAAQAEAELLKKQAREQGQAQGRAEGLAKATEEGKKAGHEQALAEHRKELTAVISAMTQAATQLNAIQTTLEANILRDVVDLALSVARKVTKRQAMIDPDVLGANLEGALHRLIKMSDCRIAIRPDQLNALKSHLPRLQLTWPALAHVELIEDGTLSPGGCRVFSAQGSVDADIDMQLDQVIGQLLPTEG